MHKTIVNTSIFLQQSYTQSNCFSWFQNQKNARIKGRRFSRARGVYVWKGKESRIRMWYQDRCGPTESRRLVCSRTRRRWKAPITDEPVVELELKNLHQKEETSRLPKGYPR